MNIATMYQEGMGLRKIGRQLGLSWRQVRKRLVEQGVTIRKCTHTRYQIDATAFDEIDDELAAYWLGFIYADGCVSKNDALRIDINSKDKDHLEKIKPFMNTERPLLPTERKGKTQVLFKVVNHHLAKRLKELGILVDRPSYSLAVSRIPQELMCHFIRGYFDGDGSARKKRVTVRFCGQVELLEWLKKHFREVLKCDCARKLQECTGTDKIMLLEFSPKDSRLIRDYLYKDATVWLERKKNIMDTWK